MMRATSFVSLLAIATLGVVQTHSAPAQETPGEDPARESLEAMRALPDLVGRWEGGGWMRQGPAEPSHFSTVEIVEPRLDGQLLLIEGIHHAKEDPDRLVFHAFAVLSWDRGKDAYSFRTYTHTGQGGDFEARVEDGAFIWGHEVPRGQIRYTIWVADESWEEVGEFSPDGKSWNQFFEMKVRRVSMR